VDLLVIAEDGTPHILDFKTSTKSYDNFGIPKKTAYTY
jgi:hypothetical protein